MADDGADAAVTHAASDGCGSGAARGGGCSRDRPEEPDLGERLFSALLAVPTLAPPTLALPTQLPRTPPAGLGSLVAGTPGSRDDPARAARRVEAPGLNLARPSTSGIPGMHVAVCVLPAVDGLGALGDFYDIFPVRRPDNTDVWRSWRRVYLRRGPRAERWDAVIGDVSGHGPQAALVAALARRTIRTLATAAKTPSQVLDRLNTVLLTHNLDDERFLTAAYATLFPGPDGVRLLLTSAGHMPALLRTSAGTVLPIAGHGLPLGLFDTPRLTNVHVVLRPGDMLLLYTDGVTEARRAREQYGEERLRALLTTAGQLSAQNLVDAIVADVLTFTSGSHTDDIAVLALRATGTAHEKP